MIIQDFLECSKVKIAMIKVKNIKKAVFIHNVAIDYLLRHIMINGRKSFGYYKLKGHSKWIGKKKSIKNKIFIKKRD